mmetsp:Transcript_77035/g.152644  ORF Transcript_77035/g.152644 Transcript_77035/m.152644 type:complete len:106 (+) Transcript_77035:937-1254(+)
MLPHNSKSAKLQAVVHMVAAVKMLQIVATVTRAVNCLVRVASISALLANMLVKMDRPLLCLPIQRLVLCMVALVVWWFRMAASVTQDAKTLRIAAPITRPCVSPM